MAGRRFSQLGHARIPASPLSPGVGGLPRLAIAGAAIALVATATVAYLHSRGAADLALLESGVPAVPLSTTVKSQPAPTLLEAALSSVQAAARTGLSAPATGLRPHPLNEDGAAAIAPFQGEAEARLISVYRLISQGRQREALDQVERLVRDHPNFHLAQLVYGDLLSVQVRPVRQLGDVPDTTAQSAAQQLSILREESRRRLLALTERPPEGAIPSQFLSLSPLSRHAIAVDASRSRLYLFENQSTSEHLSTEGPKLKLLGDFYISVGLSGIEKSSEGDKRTPLGVYYITSTLNPNSLPDLYGAGALPINYPNPLDLQRGKTGSGIWLHGTPREQFVRAPQASDGCVVLSNPDLERLLKTVEIRTTPVVIAPELQWVPPADLISERKSFASSLDAWKRAKEEGKLEAIKAFYSTQDGTNRDTDQLLARVETEWKNSRAVRSIKLKDVSVLRWKDNNDTMVVTFGELPDGQSRGTMRRQYWSKERDQWKIFFEGTP
ncbi:MAG: L,D-transpeptidase [Hydrogenophaga sp.]|nr:L,D-transpeptidase [Hydrogenophaga sp.]